MDEYPELYKKYESDPRAGVKNLIRKYQKQEEKLEQERARLEQMREYEHCYAACKWICGIDEAGRGPLAGPVVAGGCNSSGRLRDIVSELILKSFLQKREKNCMMKLWRKQLQQGLVWHLRRESMRLIFCRLHMRQ